MSLVTAALPTLVVLCPALLASAQQSASAPAPVRAPRSGQADAIAFPACAKALDDTSGPGCLYAASTPTLGKLFPLSSDFFIDAASGNVSLGGTMPTHRLEVLGTGWFSDDITLRDPNDSLVFSTGGGAPMIEMFASGTSNTDRMVLGHSSAFQDWGLLYRDTADSFVFQSRVGIINPVVVPTLTVDLGESVTVDVPLNASSGVDNSSALSVTGSATAYNNPLVRAVASIRRTSTHTAGENLLGLQVPTGSPANGQYIECANVSPSYEIDFRVDSDGEVFSDVGITTPADFAEMIEVSTGAESVEPGDVVVIDPAHPRAVVKSTGARSTLVLGVYSTKPGVVGSEREWDLDPAAGSRGAIDGERLMLKRADMARLFDEVPVAMIGIVPAKVSAENGPIQPGDLLVTSSTPGHAMRDDRPEAGTIVGKALEPLASGTGKIRIAVTLQ